VDETATGLSELHDESFKLGSSQLRANAPLPLLPVGNYIRARSALIYMLQVVRQHLQLDGLFHVLLKTVRVPRTLNLLVSSNCPPAVTSVAATRAQGT